MDIPSISIKSRSPNKGFIILQVRAKDIPKKDGLVKVTAQKMKFNMKEFLSICDQIRRK